MEERKRRRRGENNYASVPIFVEKLKKYFTDYKPCILVLRYMSKGLVQWLQTVPNPYLHFGDFDLSGLQIYISEYKKYLGAGRCSFFVPDNMEELIRTCGNQNLYDRQAQHTQNLDTADHPEIKDLARIIRKYGKGLEQEILLEH